MTPMWQVILAVFGIMVSLAILGVVVESKKKENFRAYWWGRLSAWAAANADAAHQRKVRHGIYLAAMMERAGHTNGELEPWGGATRPRNVVNGENSWRSI